MVNSQFFDKELHFLAMMDSHQIETGVTAAGPSPGVAFSRFTYTPAATKLWSNTLRPAIAGIFDCSTFTIARTTFPKDQFNFVVDIDRPKSLIY